MRIIDKRLTSCSGSRSKIAAFFVTLLWCIGVYKIDLEQVDPILPIVRPFICLGTAYEFGTNQEYALYLKGSVLYFPFLFLLCLFVISCIEHKIVVDGKWSILSVVFSIFMSIARVISNSFYYVKTWGLIKNGLIASAVLFVGWFFVFYYLILILFYLLTVWVRGKDICYANTENSLFSVKTMKILQSIDYFFSCENIKNTKFRLFAKLSILIEIIWLPRLLLNYPVCSDWDTGLIFQNAINGVDWTGYYFQLRIMEIFVKLGNVLGSYAISLFIYMFIQYLFTSMTFAFALDYFRKKIPNNNRNIVLWWIVLLSILFTPQYQSWTVIVSKDASYSVSIILLMMMMYIVLFDFSYVRNHRFICTTMFVIALMGVFCIKKSGPILIIVNLLGIFVFTALDRRNYRIKKILIFVTLLISIALVGTVVNYGKIKENESINKNVIASTILYSVDYYMYRPFHYTILYSLARNAIAIKGTDIEDLPEEMVEILGDKLPRYLQISNESDGNGLSLDEQITLFRYLLKTEPALVAQAFINSMYFDFDVWNSHNKDGASLTRVVSDNNFVFYCDTKTMDIWDLMVQRYDQYYFLKEGYHFIEDIPLLGKICNMGTYVWMMLILSSYCCLKKGIKLLSICIMPYMTLLGAMVCGYNAYVRFLLPVVLSVPLFMLIAIASGEKITE